MATSRYRGRSWVWWPVAAALIAATVPMQDFLNRARRQAGLVGDVFTALTPGEFAGTLLLGGFRGLAVDVLWLRVQRLQAQEQHHEVLALCTLISKLQPHFTEGWICNAWTLCHDLAGQEETAEGRWEWIRASIDFLEEGRKRNPGSWDVVFHEAWILENYAAADAAVRDLAEAHYGRSVHDRAAALFRRHVDFPDADVPRPYRRCGGYACRAWARDLRREAATARESRPPERDAAQRVESLRRERALLRQAVLRYDDALRDWAVVVRMAEQRESADWKAFGRETAEMTAELQRERDEASAGIRDLEEELERLGG